jgi:hypothetical protein
MVCGRLELQDGFLEITQISLLSLTYVTYIKIINLKAASLLK